MCGWLQTLSNRKNDCILEIQENVICILILNTGLKVEGIKPLYSKV